MSEQTCLMADCTETSAHFCVTHVLEVHCPTAAQLEAAVAERDAEIERLRKIAREQYQTIKHWHRHIEEMGKILGCEAVDETVEITARNRGREGD